MLEEASSFFFLFFETFFIHLSSAAVAYGGSYEKKGETKN